MGQTEKWLSCPPDKSGTKLRLPVSRHVQDFSCSLLILTTLEPVLYSWLYACLIAAAFLLLSAFLIHPVLNSVQLMAKVKPAQLLHTAFIDKGSSLEDFIMECMWHLVSSSVVTYIRLFFMLHPHELLVLTNTHWASESSKAGVSLPL